MTVASSGGVSGATAAAEAFIAPTDTSIAVRSMGSAEETGTVVLTLKVGSRDQAALTLRMDLSAGDRTGTPSSLTNQTPDVK